MKSSVILIGALLIGSAGVSNAAPPDSPETVYIDGTPCNALCQSYMAWSRQTLAGPQRPHSPPIAERRATETAAAKQKHAGADRAAAEPAPITHQMQRDKIARLRPPGANAIPIPPIKPAEAAVSAASNSGSKPPADNAGPQQPAETPAPPSDSKPDEQVAALQQPAVPAPPSQVSSPAAPDLPAKTGDADDAKTADSAKTTGDSNAADGAKTKAITNQVIAATALAEQLTSAPTTAREPKATSADDTTASTTARDNATVPVPPKETGQLVALVMTRPDVASVTDLAGKTVAIDDGRSASTANVRTALVAAGAGQVQLSSSDIKAIDRLVTSEVPAAVVTLVSPDAAETFPEIAGFKVFRIPLSP